MTAPPKEKVALFGMRQEKAQAIVRAAAKDTSCVIFSRHALERMEQRGITDIEVYRVLQSGHVFEKPILTDKKEWQCKVVKEVNKTREVGVITIILISGKLFLKTVEWED